MTFKLKLSLFLLMLFTLNIIAQDKVKQPLLDSFTGTIAATNNGISLVPTFSLGDPAALLELKMTKGRFSFEPDMRFALEGKPWSFLFWFRYKAIKKEKLNLRVGVHPALNFRDKTLTVNNVQETFIESRRYLAGEVAPSYKLSSKTSVGMYYLYSKGFDQGLKNGHFLNANANFSNLTIVKDWFLNITALAYYLNLDAKDGFYTAEYITLKKKNFPLALQTILNHKLNSNIKSESLLWNVSLIYSF